MRFERLLRTPTVARRDAPPLTGPFLLVAYSLGLNDRSQSGTVLWEYLASHGYIVAVVPQLPTSSDDRSLGLNPVDLETQLRDVEFAIAISREVAAVDPNRLAVAGHSLGGGVALLLAMRNPSVDAVITTDAVYSRRSTVNVVTDSPYYRLASARAPLLDMRRRNEASGYGSEDSLSFTVTSELKYVDRYLLYFAGVMHSDFTSDAMVSVVLNSDADLRRPSDAARAYEDICRYTLHFLDAYVKGDTSATRWPRAAPSTHRASRALERAQIFPAADRLPSAQQLVSAILLQGLETAIARFQHYKSVDPTGEIVDEESINATGYAELHRGNARGAVNIFQFNVEAHPTSVNTYDSLADGYPAAADTVSAIAAYRKLIALAEGMANPRLRDRLLWQNALTRLGQLGIPRD